MASASTSQDTSCSAEGLLAMLSDRITQAEEYKTKGNELYNAKDIRGAIGKYHRALLYVRGLEANFQRNNLQHQLGLAFGTGIDPTGSSSTLGALPEAMQQRVSAVELGCLNNLAACILLHESPNYEKVVSYCDKVLDMAPDNAKALYRKGCSLYHLGAYEDAYNCLKKAQQISKADPNIQKYLLLAKDKMTDINNEQRMLYQGIFDKMSKSSEGRC